MWMRIFAVAFVILALIAGCSDDPTTPSEGNPNDPIIPPTTIVVPVDEDQNPVAPDEGTGDIVIDEGSSLADTLVVGSIIVSGANELSPDGFIREVTAITEENGEVFVTTQQASLAQAILSGSITDSHVLTQADVDSMWVAPGVKYVPNKETETKFTFSLDRVFHDADGNDETEMDRISVEGELEISASLDFKLDIDDFQLEEFLFAIEQGRKASLTANVGASVGSYEGSIDIAEIHMGRYVIMFGFVPIVFQPVIEVELEFVVDGAVSLSIGYTLVETNRSGAHFENGEWQTINESSKETTPIAMEFEGAVTARVSLEFENELLVYGLGGPEIDIAVFLQAQASVEALPPPATISAELACGLSAGLGFEMEIFSHQVFDFETSWDIYEYTIWEDVWILGDPPAIPNSPDPADEEEDVPTSQDLSWASSDSDNDPLTYDVYFGTSTNPAIAVEGVLVANYDPGELDQGETYYWKIDAKAGGEVTEGPEWQFTTASEPPVDPQPSLSLSSPPSSITVGESFNLVIVVSNQGGVSDEAGITVSFPDLAGSQDAAQVSNNGSSTGDDLGLMIIPHGGTIYDDACGPMNASHLLAEYNDVDWQEDEVNSLRLTITPKGAGTFRYRVRSAMRRIGSTCDFINEVPSGGTNVTGQQGWACREYTVTVNGAEPVPVFNTVTLSESTIVLGESFDLEVGVTNAGDDSDEAGISISFPDLAADDDESRVLNNGSSTGDQLGLLVLAHGQTIYDDQCEPMTADHLLVEYNDTDWQNDERNNLRLTITPREAGSFHYRIRSAMGRAGSLCSFVNSTPGGVVSSIDQQGWSCREYVVTVAAPQPAPTFDNLTVTDTEITLGDSVEIAVFVTNNGDTSDQAGISVSFPDLADPQDANQVTNNGSSTGDDLGFLIIPQGDTIYDDSCEPISASYLLAEYNDSDWQDGEQNVLRLTVEPTEIGTFRYRVRSAMQRSGSECDFVNVVPSGGTSATDQQGWACREYTITVSESVPVPVFNTVARSASSITLGESFSLEVGVTNNGDDSDEAGISISFPDFDSPGDGSQVQDNGSSTGDALGLLILARSESIYDDQCESMSSDHLLVEYNDTNWQNDERNNLRLTVTPTEVGTFRYRIRSAMQRFGSACEFVNSTPDGIVNATDQQGWSCREYTVAVEAPQPDPVFEVVSIPTDPITLGESIRIRVDVRNDGDDSDQAGISISFPDLDDSDDDSQFEDYSSSSGDDLGLLVLARGETIYDDDCDAMDAQYLLVEYNDTDWEAGETNRLYFDITPREAGTFDILVRSAMGIVGSTCTFDNESPSGGTSATDQQGWSCERFTVEVQEPEPEPDFVTSDISDYSIQLGETIDLVFAVENDGEASDQAGITLSFPDLDYTGDDQYVDDIGSSAGDDLGLLVLDKGSTIYDDNCSAMDSDYLLVEYNDTDWRAGERNTVRLRVEPQARGTFNIYVRSAMQIEGTTCDFVNVIPSGSYIATDQQGWRCREFRITVY